MSAKKLLNFANLYGEVPCTNQWFADHKFVPASDFPPAAEVNILLAASVCVLHQYIRIHDHFCFLLVWRYSGCLMCKYSEHTCYPSVAYLIDNFEHILINAFQLCPFSLLFHQELKRKEN